GPSSQTGAHESGGVAGKALGPRNSPPAGAAAENSDRGGLVLLLPPPDCLASSLVFIEVAVRRLVNALPVLARRPGGDPHTDLDVLRRAHAQGGLVDRPAQPCCHIPRPIEIRLWHRDCKLVAANSRA